MLHFLSQLIVTGAYPFMSSDPFIMSAPPRVYFAGNQKRFQSRVVSSVVDGADRECLVVCVPQFWRTGELVLVDLSTLEARVVSFKTMV